MARTNPAETLISESSPSQNPTTDSAESHRVENELDRPITADRDGNREQWQDHSPSDGQRGTENHRASQTQLYEHSSQVQRSASVNLRDLDPKQYRDEPTYQAVQLGENADNRQHGFSGGGMSTVLAVLGILTYISCQTWQQINHNAELKQE